MNQGRIQLESGDWNWQLARLQESSTPYDAGERPAGRADPESELEPDPFVLLLEDPLDPSQWMSRDLDPLLDPEELGEQSGELEEWAKHPDRRQLTDSEGAAWLVEIIPPPGVAAAEGGFERPAPKVRVSRGGSPARIVRLPPGRTLGTLRREELVELLEATSGTTTEPEERADT